MHSRYPLELKEKAIQLRINGYSYSQIYKNILGPSKRTIRLWVKGIPYQGPRIIYHKWSEEYRKKACALYGTGKRISQIVKILQGPCADRISKWVRAAGLTSPEESNRRTTENLPRGDSHHFWKGDDFERERFLRKRITLECKDWRKKVYKRDNWTCQICYKRGEILVAHHLKEWANYPSLRFNVNNGQTLCQECHLDYHFPKRKRA